MLFEDFYVAVFFGRMHHFNELGLDKRLERIGCRLTTWGDDTPVTAFKAQKWIILKAFHGILGV